MNLPLTSEELSLLRAINSPTLANAIEKIGVRDRMAGFTRGAVRSIFPEAGVSLGFAVTVKIVSARKAPPPIALRSYWDYISSIPSPRMVVVQDLDQPPAGAWWGEVNANIHRALGCTGVVTDGTVRDLDEVRPLGFHFSATGISVSHAYAHPVEFGTDVVIDGMTVHPGDLIHADRHGAINIPIVHAREVLEGVLQVERFERPLIQLCKSPGFSTEKLEQLLKNAVS